MEHQHNNIDPDEPEEEEIKVQALDENNLEGTQEFIGEDEFPHVQQHSSVLLEGFPGEESKIQVDDDNKQQASSDHVEELEPLS